MHRYSLPLNGANMYLFISGTKALLIDCFRDEALKASLIKNNIQELTILLTHEHWDHASGVEWVRTFVPACKVICGAMAKENLEDARKNMSAHYKALLTLKDRSRAAEIEAADIHPFAFTPDLTVENQETYEWETHHLQFFSTPGHTKGSICILMDHQVLFTGDSLVNGHKTITRFPGGSQESYERITIPFLESQPGNRMILPGHGEPEQLEKIIHYIYRE